MNDYTKGKLDMLEWIEEELNILESQNIYIEGMEQLKEHLRDKKSLTKEGDN